MPCLHQSVSYRFEILLAAVKRRERIYEGEYVKIHEFTQVLAPIIELLEQHKVDKDDVYRLVSAIFARLPGSFEWSYFDSPCSPNKHEDQNELIEFYRELVFDIEIELGLSKGHN